MAIMASQRRIAGSFTSYPFHSRKTSAARRPLVPVDERLVLGDVKRIRGADLEDVRVQEGSVERRLRRPNRAFERRKIPDAVGAAEALQLQPVQVNHILDVQEFG